MEGAEGEAMNRNVVRIDNVCIVCGEPCNGVYVIACVDDGKPPKTPRRWRRVGVVHEACENVFNANPYRFVKQTSGTI